MDEAEGEKKRVPVSETQIREVEDRGYSTTGVVARRTQCKGGRTARGREGFRLAVFCVTFGIRRFSDLPRSRAVGHRDRRLGGVWSAGGDCDLACRNIMLMLRVFFSLWIFRLI